MASRTQHKARRAAAFLVSLACALAIAGTADAATKKKKAKPKSKPAAARPAPIAWESFTREGPGGRICFAAAEPTSKLPSGYAHGAVFFMVAEAKNNSLQDQPSLSVGYALKADTPPAGFVLSSNGRSPQTRFYVDGKEAFLERTDQERAIIAAMRSGRDLQIEAVGADEVRTTYQFSLSGFSAALEAAKRACA
jgi:invasion protein IalB